MIKQFLLGFSDGAREIMEAAPDVRSVGHGVAVGIVVGIFITLVLCMILLLCDPFAKGRRP